MSYSLLRSPLRPSPGKLRLIGYRKRESFHPDGPMWRTPIPGAAPRVCQGLDLDKVVTHPYLPFWKVREKHVGGYHYGERNMQPHVNALSPEEMVTYYDNSNFFAKFSYGELLRAYGLRFGRGYIYYMSFPALITLAMLGYFIPSNRYEAIEYYMPVDEYYDNYVWHDFGKFIDKKAYEQYLEARRAKKWGREPDVNLVDYIPEKYRNETQKQARLQD